jgi:hypothetical protein
MRKTGEDEDAKKYAVECVGDRKEDERVLEYARGRVDAMVWYESRVWENPEIC